MSNDLISRKAVLELLYKTHMDKLPINDKRITELIKELSTAYDTDKMVEQLKDYAIEFEAFGICSDYVELSHAIEIVKGGAK